jgi:Ca2+-binding RTX toxin-like protein
MFESLESRRLFAAGTSVILNISGTPGHDLIQLTQAGNKLVIKINGVSEAHDLTWVIPSPNQNIPPQSGWISGVVVDGGVGWDQILADDTVTGPLTLVGGPGCDTLHGGHGNDSLFGGNLPLPGVPYVNSLGDLLDGGAGNDHLYGASGGGTLWGGTGNDTLSSNGMNDQLHGGDGADVLTAHYHTTVLYGDAGNDTITGTSDDYIDGGADNDVITDGDGLNTISGGDGNDWISVTNNYFSHWAYVDAGNGNDTITTGSATDVIYAGEGNDIVNAGDGGNNVYGQGGNDYIAGGKDNDSFYGGEGNDTLVGGFGSNFISGDGGNDLMTAGPYNDTFYGGTGSDTVSYATRALQLNVTLDGNANDGEAVEFDNVWPDVENVIGGHAGDVITGNGYNNNFWGGDGNDTLTGGSGNDQLHGGNNDDSIYGGFGNDTLSGDAGRDTLIAIGGGNSDQLWGGADADSFWMDKSAYEHSDATSDELAKKRVHVIDQFVNTAQRDPNGPNLADPTCDAAKSSYSNNNLLGSKPLFGPNGPQINDIRQGNLGDCYYLATIASIAKANPDRIRETIVDMGDHTFAVRYFDSYGNEQYFRVDDDVPLNSNGGMYYAGLGQSGSLWVAMMEKAFVVEESGYYGKAGYQEGYGNVSGGFSEDVFQLMGITPTKLGNWASAASLKDIAAQLALGKAMTTNSDWSAYGFTPGDHVVKTHVYTIVSVDLNANTITLRNPWGSDAGFQKGAWVQGAQDGYVTFTAKEFADNFGSSWAAYA